MKKILILFLFFVSACGYQPLYKIDKDIINLEINEVKLIGDSEISKRIIDKLPYKIDKNNKFLDKIIIQSTKNIIETSKNSKGQVTSYRTEINVEFKIVNKNEIIKQKIFSEDFSYNNLDNKFDLASYQDDVENNLVNKIIEELIIFINI